MNRYRPVDLQQLLELEGENLGNLSQHLALLGVRWRLEVTDCCRSCDPSVRVARVTAWHGMYEESSAGVGQQSSDLSGDWTCEEWVLQLLELALRRLWQIVDICWPAGDRGISPND